jgi:hypothetical protein
MCSQALDLSRLHVAVEVRVNISNQVCASTCSTTPPSMPPGIWPPLCQSSPSPNYVSQASTFDRAKHRSMRTASPHGKIQNPKSLKSGLAVIHPDISFSRKKVTFSRKKRPRERALFTIDVFTWIPNRWGSGYDRRTEKLFRHTPIHCGRSGGRPTEHTPIPLTATFHKWYE